MPAERKTYSFDPARVSVIVGGIPISGFTEDSFVTASFAEEAVNFTQGIPHGSASLNTSREGDISISLLQVSDSNAELQKYITRARNRSGVWYFNFLILNNSGGELASADTAWITKEPDLTFSKDITPRSWTIKTGNLILTHLASYEVIS